MEHKALVRCNQVMVDHLVAHGCKSIADSLVGEELITFEDYSKIQLDSIDQDKARKIVEAVQNNVKAKPSNFGKFIAVLKKKGLDTLASKLQEKLSKFCLAMLRSFIASYIVYTIFPEVAALIKLRFINFFRNTYRRDIRKRKS